MADIEISPEKKVQVFFESMKVKAKEAETKNEPADAIDQWAKQELAKQKFAPEQLAELLSRIQSAPDFPSRYAKLIEGRIEDAKRRWEAERMGKKEELTAQREELRESVWYNPTTWSTEAKAAGVIGLALGGAYVLWQAFRRKTVEVVKKTADVTKQAASGTWGFLKWTFGVTVAAGLAYVGFKGWQQWKELSNITEQGKRLRDKFVEESKKTTAQLKEVAEKLRTATGPQRRELLKQYESLRIQAKQQANKLKEVTTDKSESDEVENLTPDKLSDLPRSPISQEEKEALSDATRETALNLMTNGLLFMHHDQAEQAKCLERKEQDQIQALLHFEKVQNQPIRKLLSIAEARDAATRVQLINTFLKECELDAAEERQRAVYFFALVCKERRPFVEGVTQRNDNGSSTLQNLEDLSLKQLLDRGSLASLQMGKLGAQIHKLNGKSLAEADLQIVLKDVFAGDGWLKEMFLQGDFKEKLHALAVDAKLNGLDLRDERVQERFILFCSTRLRRQIKDLPNEKLTDEERQFVRLLESVSERVRTAKSYLQLYAHNHERSSYGVGGGEKTADLIGRGIDALSIIDGIQLFAYLSMTGRADGRLPENAEESNPLAAMLIQLKVLHMVSDMNHLHALVFRDELIKRIGIAIAGGTTELHLPPTAIIALKRAFQETSKGLFAILFYSMYRGTERLSEEIAAWVEVTTGVHTDLGIPAAMTAVGGVLGYRYTPWQMLNRWRTNRILRLAEELGLTDTDLHTTLNRPRFLTHVKHSIPVWGDISKYRETSKLLRYARENLKNVRQPSHIPQAMHRAGFGSREIASLMHEAGYSFREIKSGFKMAGLRKTTHRREVIEGVRGLRTATAEVIVTPESVPSSRNLPTAASEASTTRTNRATQAAENAVEGGKKLSLAGKVARGGFAVLDLAAVGLSAYNLYEKAEQKDKSLAAIKSKLEAEHFASDDGKRFYFTVNGERMQEIYVDLESLESNMQSRTNVAKGEVVVTAGNALVGVGSLFAAGLGPALLPAAGIAIIIHIGLSAMDWKKAREIIGTAPPWLVAALGTERLTGNAPEDFTKHWFSDLFLSPDSLSDSIAHKALFAIFTDTLFNRVRTEHPEIFNDLASPLMAGPDVRDHFFNTEFRSVFIPLFNAAILQQSGHSIDTIRQGMLNVSREQINAGLLTAMLLYRAHIAEKRYHTYRGLLEHLDGGGGPLSQEQLTILQSELQGTTTEDQKKQLTEVVTLLGKQKVLGTALEDVRLDGVPAGVTRIQLITGGLYSRLSQLTNSPDFQQKVDAFIDALPADRRQKFEEEVNAMVEKSGYWRGTDSYRRLKELKQETIQEARTSVSRQWFLAQFNLADRTSVPALSLQSTSEFLVGEKIVPKTLHISIDRWGDHRTGEKAIAYPARPGSMVRCYLPGPYHARLRIGPGRHTDIESDRIFDWNYGQGDVQIWKQEDWEQVEKHKQTIPPSVSIEFRNSLQEGT